MDRGAWQATVHAVAESDMTYPQQCAMVGLYHVSFICSSVDERLGCVHI